MRKLNSIFVFFAVFFIVFSLVLYSVLGRNAREAVIVQTLHREQGIARSGASSIKSFLDLLSKSLILLFRNDDITSMGPDTQRILESFISNWQSTPVVGTFWADKKGNVRFISDRKGFTSIKNVSIVDRDFYLWAKKALKGDIFLGKPILPRLAEHRNQHLIPLATPLYRDSEFNGVLVVTILLSDLTEDYLDPLKISENTQVYLLNSQGLLLHSPSQELVGLNAFDYLGNHPFLGSEVLINILKEKLNLKKEGSLNVAYPDFKSGVLTPMLIAYSPINYNGQHWLLAVATPTTDTLALLAPFYINQLAVLIIGFLSLTIIAVVIAKSRVYKEYKETQG